MMGEEESVFFRTMAPERLLTLQERAPHIHAALSRLSRFKITKNT